MGLLEQKIATVVSCFQTSQVTWSIWSLASDLAEVSSSSLSPFDHRGAAVSRPVGEDEGQIAASYCPIPIEVILIRAQSPYAQQDCKVLSIDHAITIQICW